MGERTRSVSSDGVTAGEKVGSSVTLSDSLIGSEPEVEWEECEE